MASQQKSENVDNSKDVDDLGQECKRKSLETPEIFLIDDELDRNTQKNANPKKCDKISDISIETSPRKNVLVHEIFSTGRRLRNDVESYGDRTLDFPAKGEMLDTFPATEPKNILKDTQLNSVYASFFETKVSQAQPNKPVNNMNSGNSFSSDGFDDYRRFQHQMIVNAKCIDHSSTSQSILVNRASPFTVKWLLDNFEGAEGVSLPRATLYALYLQHCSECAIESMNAASFGKMIRSIFSGLRTRRLGTRGNSKYHYYGIKLKSHSILQRKLTDLSNGMQYSEENVNCKNNELETARERISKTKYCDRYKSSLISEPKQMKNLLQLIEDDKPAKKIKTNIHRHLDHVRTTIRDFKDDKEPTDETYKNNKSNFLTDTNEMQNTKRNFLSEYIQNFPLKDLNIRDLESDKNLKSIRLTQDNLNQFVTLYREKIEASIASINSGSPENILSVWKAFWRHTDIHESSLSYKIIENRLTKEIFLKLCCNENILQFIFESDAYFYQVCIDHITNSLNQSEETYLINVRSYATIIYEYIIICIQDLDKKIKDVKMESFSLFIIHLKLITSIYHASQTVRNITRSKTCLTQLMNDIKGIDFSELKTNFNSICEVQGDGTLMQFKDTFFGLFSENNSIGVIENFRNRCENMIEKKLEIFAKNTVNNDLILRQIRNLKELYTNWITFSSLLLRQITLNGCNSFGLFHVIRTLIDDILLLSIKNKASIITKRVSIISMYRFDRKNDVGIKQS